MDALVKANKAHQPVGKTALNVMVSQYLLLHMLISNVLKSIWFYIAFIIPYFDYSNCDHCNNYIYDVLSLIVVIGSDEGFITNCFLEL